MTKAQILLEKLNIDSSRLRPYEKNTFKLKNTLEKVPGFSRVFAWDDRGGHPQLDMRCSSIRSLNRFLLGFSWGQMHIGIPPYAGWKFEVWIGQSGFCHPDGVMRTNNIKQRYRYRDIDSLFLILTGEPGYGKKECDELADKILFWLKTGKHVCDMPISEELAVRRASARLREHYLNKMREDELLDNIKNRAGKVKRYVKKNAAPIVLGAAVGLGTVCAANDYYNNPNSIIRQGRGSTINHRPRE